VTDTPRGPHEVIVGDRAKLLDIGMAAVFIGCAVFAALRLGAQLLTGRATPWWGNAAGVVAITLVYVWYRGNPASRMSGAVHATAAIATIALFIPIAYGMTSSKWWLALVGFSVLLMGNRTEALVWTVLTLILLPLAALLEPHLMVANSAGEPATERAAAGLVFVAILLGITWAFRRVAQQRARELTETAASLSRANLVKTRFLAHMSHEVRTPLHGVIAMTDMALEGEASPLVREQIETAQQSARMLLSLLNNILDVARAESDAIELDPRPFSLHETLAEVLRPLAAQARGKGLDFVARSEAGVSRLRVGDPVRLSQIVLNLVGNALKFTKSGRIEVRLRSLPGDKDRVALEVADTGAGIPQGKLDAIFEPFTQSSPADAHIQGGAGLGLTIVRDLAKRMGGGVRVDSAEGKGAKFTVELRLPCAGEGASEAGPVDLLPVSTPLRVELPSIGALNVLVCEDNPVNQKILVAMLARLGHTVTVANDGLAAWEILQRQSFNLLLTDVEMPGLDGLELARRVRAREAERGEVRLPILCATAHAGDEERNRLVAAGMDAHLGKPFTLNDLTAALRRASRRVEEG
jgi:signal transduction histidine kinase/ActR/RegA family two-component response regulator